jgi:hypothetical protein
MDTTKRKKSTIFLNRKENTNENGRNNKRKKNPYSIIALAKSNRTPTRKETNISRTGTSAYSSLYAQ